MKAINISEFVKDYEDIRVSEVSKPLPREGEVIVQIAAAGVNYVDLLYCRGLHQNNRRHVKPPFILGLEFAGTILHASSSSSFRVGDRVFGGCLGSYAQQISVPEHAIHSIPSSWSFAAAAGFGATAPVSYGALMLRGKIKQGETVLVHAAAGGLGLMAVQIAKAARCRVIATASSKEKLDVATRFGADGCVDYTKKDWWEDVLSLTAGEGVDVVYDTVGLVEKSMKCLKPRGRVLVVGFAGRNGENDKMEKVAMNKVLLKQVQVIGYRYGETDRIDPSETTAAWKGLQDLWERGLLKPTTYDGRYEGLKCVPAAMKDLSERKVWGKAVILIDETSEKPRL